MIYIGSHLSSTGGFEAMGRHAQTLGEDTFAFFLRNPRGGAAKAIDPDDADKLRTDLREHAMGPLVAHAPYTMNLCSGKDDVREKAAAMLADDLKRMEFLPGNFYNFHPGSHVGQGTEAGIALIADALAGALPEAVHTTVLLETMAGKGSEIGGRFEELRAILDRTGCPEKTGVCFDTCHVWDAGYDIANDLDGVLTEFDRAIGLGRLRAVHLNDSKNARGSRKDRHAKLGEGAIGLEALRRIVRHPVLQNLPFILETPNDDAGYQEEVELVRTWMA